MELVNIDKAKKKKVRLKSKKGNKYTMSVYELARWQCLMEAISLIDQKTQQMGLPESDNSWVKPLAIQKYVNERTESMIFDMQNEE